MHPLRVFVYAALAAPLAAQPQQAATTLVVSAPAPLVPGVPGLLRVELRADDGRPATAARTVLIQLKASADLGASPTVSIPAGSASAEVALHPNRAGAWTVEAMGPGLFSGIGLVVCVEPRASPRPPAPPPPPLPASVAAAPVPARPGPAADRGGLLARTTAAGGLSAALGIDVAAANTTRAVAPTPLPRGRIVLYALPARTFRRGAGFPAVAIESLWFLDGSPEGRDTELPVSFVLEGPDGAGLDPQRISIPSGQYQSPQQVKLTAAGEGTARVKAFYFGGSSDPITVDFLPARAAALGFNTVPDMVKGISRARLDASVRLLDDNGALAAAGQDVAIVMTLTPPSGLQKSLSLVIPKGDYHVETPIQLDEFGSHRLQVTSLGLRTGDTAILYVINWIAIGLALLGGGLGSLALLLVSKKKLRLGRVLLIGLFASLLVLLMASFGVLALLEAVGPGIWQALEKVPLGNDFGVLLLGFVAGLAGETILGFMHK